MFFSVARPRQLFYTLLLFFSPLVYAKDESLFTSSVTYCAPAESLLIQQFDVAYIAKNASIVFNISAASVQTNLNVSANLLLNVYGSHPFNFTIDLCSIFGGALCPLPMYNFTGTDSIALPSSLGVSNKIPGIAYKIPDLEAFAQLTLFETSTGALKACVQSTLSNGCSARQKAVEWSTRGMALLALLSAIWQSRSPDSLAPHRLLDLFYLFQSIGMTGLLNVNYPSVYRAFVLNFAWAMGFFSSSSLSSIQRSINNMRHMTGGNMADSSGGSAVGLVNRKLSPYNQPPPLTISPHPLAEHMLGIVRYFAATLSKFAPANLASVSASELAAGEVQTVTQGSGNILQAGVPIYVNEMGIATANAFMTVFFSALILMAAAISGLTLAYLVIFVMSLRSGKKQERYMEKKHRFPMFARSWGIRLCLIAFTPIIVFAFYQWTLKDSWLSILLSVLLLIFILGCILYPAFLTVRMARRDTTFSLYTNTEQLASHGPLYAQYRTPRYYFTLILLIAIFLKALFIAFAKANGEVQVILTIVVELGVLASYLLLKPYKTKGGDILATYLAIVRFVCAGLMVAFLENLSLTAIPRVIIGIVMAVLFSIAVIVLFVNIILHLPGVNGLRKARQPSQHDSADESILEKGEASLSSTESMTHLGRPHNPTPERNIPLDPEINEPYPNITPTQTTAGPPSSMSVDTNSTNLGSLLPRRWSFQQSQSLISPQSHHSTSPHSVNFLSTPSTPRRSLPPSPIAEHEHSRPPTIDEYPSSHHAL